MANLLVIHAHRQKEIIIIILFLFICEIATRARVTHLTRKECRAATEVFSNSHVLYQGPLEVLKSRGSFFFVLS